MASLYFELMLIAVVTAAACALPGLFLVLRGMALMSDAISHATILGIAVMFMCTRSLDSGLLLVGAVGASMATVFLTEILIASGRLYKDAAVGLVFPLFFSVGVLLISKYASCVHLDIDMVMLGELAFAPFVRVSFFGIDCGPKALWQMGTLFLCNSLFIACAYRSLQAAIFDPSYAAVARLAPQATHYGLMVCASITAVGAFQFVGAPVVVALMIVPAATASLCTKRLFLLVPLVCGIAVMGALLGIGVGMALDVSLAGSIAVMAGVLFLVALYGTVNRKWY